jgi:hypothetical protein
VRVVLKAAAMELDKQLYVILTDIHINEEKSMDIIRHLPGTMSISILR